MGDYIRDWYGRSLAHNIQLVNQIDILAVGRQP
jgi:hypothetical protein